MLNLITAMAWRLSTSDLSFDKKFSHKDQITEDPSGWNLVRVGLDELDADVTVISENAVIINGKKYGLEKRKMSIGPGHYYQLVP